MKRMPPARLGILHAGRKQKDGGHTVACYGTATRHPVRVNKGYGTKMFEIPIRETGTAWASFVVVRTRIGLLQAFYF